MAVTNQRRRNWIRRLFDKSVEQHVSFLDQIKAERNAAVDANLTGDFASISGNGMATVFATSGITPGDAETLIGQIEDLYQSAIDDLAGQSSPVESPTDEQVLDTMLLLTAKHTRIVYNDFSGIPR